MNGNEAILFAFVFILLGGVIGLSSFILAARLWEKLPPLDAILQLLAGGTKE